jgi:hypothetical protein
MASKSLWKNSLGNIKMSKTPTKVHSKRKPNDLPGPLRRDILKSGGILGDLHGKAICDIGHDIVSQAVFIANSMFHDGLGDAEMSMPERDLTRSARARR